MLNLDWSKIGTLEYWLQGIPGNTEAPFIEIGTYFFWFYLYLFSTLIVIGIILRVAQAFIDEFHPLQKRIPLASNNLIWVGVLGLFWYLMRQLNFGLFGARLWLIVFFIWGVIVGYILIRDFLVFYPIELSYFRSKKLSTQS